MDEPRIVRAYDVDEAIDRLETDEGAILWLEVALMQYPEGMTEAEDEEYTASLRRFLELLEDPETQSIRELILYGGHLDAHTGRPRGAVERLLRDVVPNYRPLQKLAFGSCAVDAPLLRTLADAMMHARRTTGDDGRSSSNNNNNNNDLWQFSLHDVRIDGDGLRAVANGMVGRNVLLRSLYLDLTRFSPAACALVCRSLRTNTHLRRPAAGGPARPFPRLSPSDAHGTKPKLECVRWSCFGPYLRRNRRIRKALREQWEPLGYRVAPSSLWPLSFELVRDLPTLLYRLVRRGNLKALCDAVAGGDQANKKRRAQGGGGGGGAAEDSQQASKQPRTASMS